jgi:hypothetical protein
MPVITALPTQGQIQDQFDAKANAGVSPCQWIPPKWADLADGQYTKKALADTCSNAGSFDNNGEADARVVKDAQIDPQATPESLPDDNTWPHPFADTSHVDETQFNKDDYKEVVAALASSSPALARLKRIVGPDSAGMKRLARIFEWALYRTTELLGDINKGLNNEKDYNDARDNYLTFLRDLDDHEPGLHSRKLDVKDKKSHSGYGKAMKWVCIDPVIFKGQIYGARVVIKWNPHSSSNGVPIKHTP